MPTRAMIALACITLGALAPTPTQATEPFEQVASYVQSALLNPIGIRSIGMGSTGTAAVSPLSAGYFNPAGLAWADGLVVASEHQEFSADENNMGVHLTVGSRSPEAGDERVWRLGGMVGYVANHREPMTFPAPPFPSGTTFSFEDDYSVSLLGAASGAYRAFTIALGAGAKRVRLRDVNLTGTNLEGWAFDLGMLLAWSYSPGGMLIRPRVGLSMSDFPDDWPDEVTYQADRELRAGFGLDVASRFVLFAGRTVPAVSVSVDYDRLRDSDRELEEGETTPTALGFEISLFDLVQARLGHHDRFGVDTDAHGFGLGWEFGRWMVRGDYARQSWSTPAEGDRDADAFGLAAGVRF